MSPRPTLLEHVADEIVYVKALHDQHDRILGLAVEARRERRVVPLVHRGTLRLGHRFCRLQRVVDDDEIAALRAELHRHEERLRNLRELRIEGEIDRREYHEYKSRIEAEREEVQARLAEVGAIEELHRIKDILEQVTNAFDLFGGNPAQQHLAFELLFERIE